MKFERTLRKTGNSIGFLIPPDIVKFMELTPMTEIVIVVKEGKLGRYIAFWRKDETVDELDEQI